MVLRGDTQGREEGRRKSFHCPHIESLCLEQLGSLFRPVASSSQGNWVLFTGLLSPARMNTDPQHRLGVPGVCVKHLGSGNLFKDKKRELGGNLDMTEWG